MVNQSLLYLLESVLGPSKKKARNNYAFVCPKCKDERLRLGKSHDHKLEIQLETNLKNENPWNCWYCSDFKGKKLINLFRKINAKDSEIQTLRSLIIPSAQEDKPLNFACLPQEFAPINLDINTSSLVNTRALTYLKNRGLTTFDILKYNIGYCASGKYNDRIIIPSYDKDNQLNFFSARAIGDSNYKYLNPAFDKNIIGFEFFINFDLPIILVEGMMDAISVKRNAIPLMGKTINEALMKKIVTSQVKKIYLCLDNDALKQSYKHVEQLLKLGKEVYLIELKDKDPSTIGFQKFTEIIQQVMPITYEDLLIKKLDYA